MATYNTKQKSATEDYLRANSNRHFTVDSLLLDLQGMGEHIGRTTVYRTLERLVSEGKVSKYAQCPGESACYQYVGGDTCHEHFHLKCEDCGRLIHLECGQIDELGAHIEQDHGFKLNKFKTVFYGVCGECAKR